MPDPQYGVYLGPRVWGRIASEADTRGVTVEDVLVAAINHIIDPDDRRERILMLVAAGYTDTKIAELVAETRRHVTEVRRYAGMQPNVKRDRRAP